MELLLQQLDCLAEEKTERFAVLKMRKFFGWYSKGARGGSDFRQKIFKVETIDEVKKIVRDFQIYVQRENVFNTSYIETVLS